MAARWTEADLVDAAARLRRGAEALILSLIELLDVLSGDPDVEAGEDVEDAEG